MKINTKALIKNKGLKEGLIVGFVNSVIGVVLMTISLKVWIPKLNTENKGAVATIVFFSIVIGMIAISCLIGYFIRLRQNKRQKIE